MVDFKNEPPLHLYWILNLGVQSHQRLYKGTGLSYCDTTHGKLFTSDSNKITVNQFSWHIFCHLDVRLHIFSNERKWD